MISPKMFASIPFKDRTALVDMAGTLELYFHGLVAQTPTAFKILPIGTVGGQVWLDEIQALFDSAGDALSVEIPDLASYDLSDAADFASWTFALSNALESLRVAAGVA